MPLSTRPKTEAPEYVVCWCSFAGPNGDANRGERFRADAAIVLGSPEYFLPDGTPEREWGTEFDHSIERAAEQERLEREEREARFQAEAKANRVELKARLFVATRDIVTSLNGFPTTIVKGSLVTSDDRLLGDHPDDFEPA